MKKSASCAGPLHLAPIDGVPSRADDLFQKPKRPAIDLSTVSRDALPVGVSSMQASRMRLDCRGAPAMLDMRLNYRNLLNEMSLNGGRIVSHQYALMKPRPRAVWQKPKKLVAPEGIDPVAFARVAERRARAQMAKDMLDSCEDSSTYEVISRRTTSVGRQSQAGEEEGLGIEDDDARQQNAAADPTGSLEVQELMNEKNVQEAFKALEDRSNPGYLPEGRIVRALEALGYDPDLSIVKSTIRSLLRFDPSEAQMSLAFDEFCAVVNAVSHRRVDALRDAFKALDKDGSGTINIREFRHLLWDLGFTVTEGTIKEIFNEVDNDQSGEVELAEFEEALQVVHDRHGFTKSEADDLLAIFDRYDQSGTGKMSSHELASALGWFGTPTTIQQAKEIISNFDQDANAHLCRCEFLMVMRSRLEDEMSDLRSLFAEFDVEKKGALTEVQLLGLFAKMGYTVPREVVSESVKELGPASTIMGLIFEDVCKLLTTIRKREGFSKSEVDELMATFKMCDRTGQGELREFELAHVMNWLGYPLSHSRRRKLWCYVDVDKNNFIDPNEFLKLVRLLREEETRAAQKLLEVSNSGQSMPRERDVKDMLYKLGYHPSAQLFAEGLKRMSTDSGGAPDLLNILAFLRFLREGMVKNLRESAGLSDTMASKIKGKFRMKLDSGRTVEPQEFERFMYELFKSARSNAVERDKIKQLVRDHAVNGTLGLNEMFWIVRLYGDTVEEDKLEKEKNSATSVGFTEQQVAQFRQAFVVADLDGSGELSEEEILTLFEDVVSLSAAQVSRLHMELEELGDRKDSIDFSEFLRILGLLVNSDEAGEL
mmetsp:Transcript_16148/g.34921  ORF Transcript_16148/g.34921 Transcript_16148/m.34921 type:complete len:825 (+) Transcript_16148:59-2533(+)